MCVSIVKNNKQYKYDTHKSFEEQVDGSSEIIVNYLENDNEVDHFLNEIKRYAMTSYNNDIKIKVVHNNLINGAKAQRQIKEATREMTVNELIRLLSLSYEKTDKKLSEIKSMCMGTTCNE